MVEATSDVLVVFNGTPADCVTDGLVVWMKKSYVL